MGLAIVVTLATVVTPHVVGMLDRARVERAIESFEGLGEAVAAFDEDVNRYPSSLTQLIEPVTDDQLDACGTKFPKGLADKWAGPYLGRLVPEDGLPVAVGLVTSPLNVVTDGSQTSLRLSVVQVSVEDAEELERRVDGVVAPSEGAVRYAAPDAQGLVTMFFHVPMRKC